MPIRSIAKYPGARESRLVAAGIGIVALVWLMVGIGRHVVLTAPREGPLNYQGTPLELIALLWFLLIAALELAARGANGDARLRLHNHIFLLSIVGSGSVVMLIVDTWGRITPPLHYWVAASAIFYIFLDAAFVEHAGWWSTIRHSWRDAVLVARRITTWAVIAVGVAATAMAPREVSTLGTLPPGPAFQNWYRSQPRVPLELPGKETVAVRLIEFVDYQCPFSKMGAEHFTPVLAELTKTYGTRFEVQRVDFPLESECNKPDDPQQPEGQHLLACEAAVAVRLAAGAGQADELRAWLWKNQNGLSRDSLLTEVTRIVGPQLFDERYDEILGHVRRDVTVAKHLGVMSTPTFWLNGVVISDVINAENLRWAVQHEMAAADAAPTNR